MSTPVVILGSGAHGIDILDTLLLSGEAYKPLGFLDDRPATPEVHGYPVLGPLHQASALDPEIRFVSAIGSSTGYRSKPALFQSLGLARERFISLVHPTASVSQWAQLGLGSVVLQHCTLSAGCRVGDQVVILPACRISHDCQVEDFNILATGVILCGHVQVEPNCYLGAGALVRERLRLGEGCLVGMGSVVIGSLEPGQRVAGNPARPLKSRNP
ncbi:acetyltransferase [bacterium]|nr:acetyltransferase [bacterium]